MASGEGQSNPSTSRDAGGDYNEDYGDEYGPPLPTMEELREMEYRRLPFWLDPETGEGCFVKSARDLNIVWGDDPRYWRWEAQPDSWFVESAFLRNVCWFEVHGAFQGVFLPGAYTVSFLMKFSEPIRGWAGAPVKFSLSTTTGHIVESQRFFSGQQNQGLSNLAPLRSLTSCSWLELDIGHFDVHQEMPIGLKFSMMEIEGGTWKNGVLLDCVKIHPTRAI
ncbi:hypothetical protein L7F22_065645 [Adiantum nelumboides]|nr:hypothetical protein [Adiantum nelumboides]